MAAQEQRGKLELFHEVWDSIRDDMQRAETEQNKLDGGKGSHYTYTLEDAMDLNDTEGDDSGNYEVNMGGGVWTYIKALDIRKLFK
jgi:hypothetical protein